MSGFADHFSHCAAGYAAYRPTYPPSLIEHLVSLCGACELAWDVGTGSGQAAVLLGAHFPKVVATDASADQIAHARTHPRVTYRTTPAHVSGLAAASVDLVTVAQALHWFDLTTFYDEVRRVSKRTGLIAVWCYGRIRIDNAVDPVLGNFYTTRVGRYWPVERQHVETAYRDLPFPFDEIPQEEWAITARLTRRELVDYAGTWSAVQKARTAEGSDPLPEFEAALRSVWPEHESRNVTWPIALRVGRRTD